MDDTGFRCIVSGLTLWNINNMSGHGSNIHDASFKIIINHDSGCFTADDIFTGKVYIQAFSPFFNGSFKRIFMVAYTSIVYYNIQSSIYFHNFFHSFFYAGLICCIGNDVQNFSTL